MRQEIDERTQYLLQNHSLIEDSISVEEPEPEVEDNQKKGETLQRIKAMNRRNLFKLLAGATLAAAIEVTGLVPVLKKKVVKAIVNPAYVEAQYEDLYFFRADRSGSANVLCVSLEEAKRVREEWFHKNPQRVDEGGKTMLQESRPPRYNFENGKWALIPYYATIEEEVPV